MTKTPISPPNDPPFSRRVALAGLAGLGATALLAACSSTSKSGSAATIADSTTASTSEATASTSVSTGATTATTAAAGTATAPIPEETGGPYPGDGTNGPDVLAQDGIVRSDIRSSFGSSTTVAAGVPLTIVLDVTDAATGSAKSDAAIYVWHCDRDGQYSMYSQAVTNENYLRGVQGADADGTITFSSIFPAAYSGRWPHIHLEVYSSIDAATNGGTPIRTSQIALPEDTCNEVYATSGYSQSVRNLSQTSLQTDNVFGDDGGVYELATMTGSVSSGLTATLAVPV